MNHSTSEEKRQHSSKLIPYSYYVSLIPDYFSNVPLHWHSEFEINYILQGNGDFICGDERFAVTEGDIIILQPNILHAVYTYKDSRLFYDTIVFHAEMLGASLNDRCAIEYIHPIIKGNFTIQAHLMPSHPHYAELKATIESIFSCAKGNLPSLDLLLKSELMRLFWLLEANGAIGHREQLENNRSENLRPILEYINENFSETLTIEQLARKANLSKSYFMNCFKQVAGVGAIEYITQLRINAACQKLISTDMTAAEVAFTCGFNNLSNFNRHFKKLVGCTPNEYKKLHAMP